MLYGIIFLKTTEQNLVICPYKFSLRLRYLQQSFYHFFWIFLFCNMGKCYTPYNYPLITFILSIPPPLMEDKLHKFFDSAGLSALLSQIFLHPLSHFNFPKLPLHSNDAIWRLMGQKYNCLNMQIFVQTTHLTEFDESLVQRWVK